MELITERSRIKTVAERWTRLVCDECRKSVTKVAVLYAGDGNATFEICESCATKVKTLFKTGVAK